MQKQANPEHTLAYSACDVMCCGRAVVMCSCWNDNFCRNSGNVHPILYTFKARTMALPIRSVLEKLTDRYACLQHSKAQFLHKA